MSHSWTISGLTSCEKQNKGSTGLLAAGKTWTGKFGCTSRRGKRRQPAGQWFPRFLAGAYVKINFTMDKINTQPSTRRDFLRFILAAGGGALLAGCDLNRQIRANLAKDIEATVSSGNRELEFIPEKIRQSTYLLRCINDSGAEQKSGTVWVLKVVSSGDGSLWGIILTADHALPNFDRSVLITEAGRVKYPAGRPIMEKFLCLRFSQ